VRGHLSDFLAHRNEGTWQADHDLELKDANQTSIYAGRGMLIESQGPTWLYGVSAEHFVLYQFNFAGAANVFAGFLQTESAYYCEF
jgi:hypothetical protein